MRLNILGSTKDKITEMTLVDNSVVRCANEIIDICHELKALLSVNGAFDAYVLLEKVETSDDYDSAMEIRNKSIEGKK